MRRPLLSATDQTPIANPHIVAFTLMALAGFIALSFLVGYRAIVDDVFYVYGANQWLIDPPHLGHTHWELRLPYVLSIAASYSLFGFGNWQTALPGILSFSVLAGCSYYFFREQLTDKAAITITLTLIISPIFFINSSYITPDVMEALFVATSVFGFVHATKSKKYQLAWLVLSGGLAGLAMSTRFTSAGLLLFFAILFLFWPQIRRVNYIALAAGFALTFGANFLFAAMVDGNPWHRIDIAKTQHIPNKDFSVFTERDDMGIRAWEEKLAARKARRTEAAKQDAKRTPRQRETLGPLSVERSLLPYTALVSNHETGLLFIFLLPGIPLILFSKALTKPQRNTLLLFGLLGLSWFVSTTYILGLRPHPRYYLMTALGATVWVGFAFYLLLQAKHKVVAILSFMALLSANLLSGSLDGTDLHEEQRLISITKRYPEQDIHVLPGTRIKARFFLEIESLDKRVSTELTPPGGLFFFTPPDQYKFDPDLRPPASWIEVEPYERRKTLLGRVFGKDTLSRLAGPYIADRLTYSSPGSALYQIPQDQPGMTQEQSDNLGAKKLVLTN